MKKNILLFWCFFYVSLSLIAQNKALSFGGNQNYVTIPFFQVPENLTVEAWIKTTQTTTGTIISWKNVSLGSNGDASLFRIYNGYLQFGEWKNKSTWREVNSIAKVNTGAWTHVAVVRNGSLAECYVNGVLSGTGSLHENSLCSTDKLLLGAISTNFSESFVGLVDEVRIWNVARTASEIYNNYTSEITGSESGLVGYWTLNNNANDKTSAARHGVITGATYVSSDIFESPVPEFSSLSFSENTTNAPALTVNATQKGTVFWGVLPVAEVPATLQELTEGNSRLSANGSFSYDLPNIPKRNNIWPALTTSRDYKVYAVIRNIFGGFSQIISSPEFTFQNSFPLPSGWITQDIGSTSVLGSAVEANGTYTIKGSGADVWNTADAFRYVFKEVSGDVQITARVKSLTATDPWTKVGVMIRNSADANSINIFAAITPSNGVGRYYRSSTAGASTYTNGNASTAPYWVRIIRRDNLFAAYYSADGQSWARIGSTISLSFDYKVNVGLVVCSHNNSQLATAEFDNVSITEPNTYLSLNDIGTYFYKQKYIPTALPVFEKEKSKLPEPVLDENPDYINMYYKAWELAFAHMKAPQPGSPLVSNWYDEAFDSNIYQWDIIFMTQFGRYANHIFPGIQSLDNFYCRQNLSGSISRIITESTGAPHFDDNSTNQINPPLFSWAEVLNYELTGDKSRFELVLPALEKYFEYVDNKRIGTNTPHKLYWSNGQASGMDNTPRDSGRPGGHYAGDQQGWVDMSAQMVIQCNNIAKICDELGYAKKALKYRNKAKEIADKMNTWMWNETDGLYYDVDVNGNQTKWKTAACFWPMLAGITSDEQDERLVLNLKNPATFWRPLIFPTLAADQVGYRTNGGYWLGAVWAPTNYAIIKGLEKRGFDEFAYHSSLKYLDGIYQVYKTTGTLWENYAPELIDGNFRQGTNEHNPPSDCRKDFVGWTGLAPISVLIENVLGFRVNGVKKHLVYDLRRLDRHGIKNLRMNDITTTIITEARTNQLSKVIMKVISDKPYSLEIWRNGEIQNFSIVVGENNIVLDEITSVNQVSDSNPIELYYFQSNKSVNLKAYFPQNESAEVKFLDMNGKQLIRKPNILLFNGRLDESFNVSAFSKGMYIFEIKSGKSIFKRKIIL